MAAGGSGPSISDHPQQSLRQKVRIIAVEGLNAFYQEDLDRYIRARCALEQVQKVRQPTSISSGLIRTTYQQFLEKVVGESWTAGPMKLRVIAADPPWLGQYSRPQICAPS
jgi:hypothetical protein